MQISKEDAIVILEMEEVCYGEGIGPDCDDLLRRIIAEFGDDIAPEYVRQRLALNTGVSPK